MRKIIIIRSDAFGLGELLKNGSEIELEKLASEESFSNPKKTTTGSIDYTRRQF